MSDIRTECIDALKIKQKEVELAKKNYDTEKYEEDIWAETLDDSEEYIIEFDSEISGLEGIINNLDTKKDKVSEDMNNLDEELSNMTETYNQLKDIPSDKLTKEQKEFLNQYEKKKQEIIKNKSRLEFSLEEISNAIGQKELQIKSREGKKALLEQHIEMRVKTVLAQETEEANKAYEKWQELKKEQEEKEEYYRKYIL